MKRESAIIAGMYNKYVTYVDIFDEGEECEPVKSSNTEPVTASTPVPASNSEADATDPGKKSSTS